MSGRICGLGGDYTWRRWARLAYRSARGDPPISRDSSPFDHQSLLMKAHFMATAKIV